MATNASRDKRSSLLATPPSRRISLPASQRLSTIMENNAGAAAAAAAAAAQYSEGNTSPTSPLVNMPLARRFHLGEPPSHHAEKRPPSYSTQPPDSRRSDPFHPDTTYPLWFERLRNRGGWRRIALIALAVVIIAIALGVGLGVGLTQSSNNNHSNGSPTQSPASEPTLQGPFPIGVWTMQTYLTSTNSSCVENSATWNCPPYTTHDQSPSGSSAVFTWIINSTTTPPSNSSLQIASTYNPLSSLTVPPTQLTLRNEGQSDEHFSFNLILPKTVAPRSAITADNTNSICYFNGTLFSASLYTRKFPTLTASGGTPTMAQAAVAVSTPWPFALDIQQLESGGDPGIPACYPAAGATVNGPRINGLTSQGPGTQCLCHYQS